MLFIMLCDNDGNVNVLCFAGKSVLFMSLTSGSLVLSLGCSFPALIPFFLFDRDKFMNKFLKL